MAMYRNYLKIAIRSIKRHKVYSLINISGLTIGIACFVLIMLWVRHETSFDSFHENANELYRVNSRITKDAGSIVTTSSFALGKSLQELYPEVENYMRYFWNSSTMKYDDTSFFEQRFRLVDSSIFEMFSFPFIKGNPKTALSNTNSIVITEEIAIKYFGDDDPIGKVMTANNEKDFIVTGVIENLPDNSIFSFQLLASIELMPKRRLEAWELTGPTYILLNKNISINEFNEKIASFYRDNVNPESSYDPYVQKITDIHLYEFGRPGRSKYVYIFSLTAFFILIIACINYMNISTARSGSRAREIGLRKVVGAKRSDIIKQFYGESILLSFIALFLAIIIVEILLPAFNNLTGKQIAAQYMISDSKMIIGLIAIALFTGIVAGSYPAVFISSFQPVNILKGIINKGKTGSVFRKTLVITQFSISIILIMSTVVVHKQLTYIQNKNLGYDREEIIVIERNTGLLDKFEDFKNEIKSNANVVDVSATAAFMLDVGNAVNVNWDGNPNEDPVLMRYTMVDHDFINTFGIKMLEGRNFSTEYSTDVEDAFVINETALKLMKVEDPIGKQIEFLHSGIPENLRKGKIIGVVKDFHVNPLNSKISPFVMRIYPPYYSYIYIKINSTNISSTINYLRDVSKQYAPDFPFRYAFVNEIYSRQYQAEQRLSQIFIYFTAIAVFISCLGLFGLTSFVVEQRTKEIGLRKILGASVSGITILLSKEFTKWVFIANLIALPLAWLAMDNWLSNYAYHTNVGISPFVISALVVFFVAIITVSYQSVKLALTNPVDSLRSE